MIRILLLLTLLIGACKGQTQESEILSSNTNNQQKSKETALINIDSSKHAKYAWLKDYDINQMLVNRIAPPKGYRRVVYKKGTWSDWLRHLPLKPKGTKVYLYNGTLKSNQKVHEAVINMDIGKQDLQQCADAVMRLKAEYHYVNKRYRQIHFNFTSGHRVSFDDWRQGKKPIVRGNKVEFTPIQKVSNNTYKNFRRYLKVIFSYAGTASLSKELKRVDNGMIEAGDIFIQGGFPGHAVLVLDVVENELGDRLFLLGQSYMPAQAFHILKNYKDKHLSPWYSANDEVLKNLQTPEWSFGEGDWKRF